MAIKNDTQFVIKNGVAIQPDIPHDGLELYYDVKGKKNTDNYKSTLLDMSGKGRHGTLSNFAYEGVSGFTGTPEGGLLLDDVDDKIVRPAISGIEYTSASRNLFNTITAEWESGTFDVLLTDDTVNTSRIRQVSKTYTVDIGVQHTVSVATGYLVNLNVNGVNQTYAQAITFTSTDGAVRFVIKRVDEAVITTSELATAKLQLEKGSVATTYTPYISLPIMTYQMNGNVLSFEKDGTVKRTTKDVNGNEVVVSRKGINLVRNGNFVNEVAEWTANACSVKNIDGSMIVTGNGTGSIAYISDKKNYRTIGHVYYAKAIMRVLNSNCNAIRLVISGVGVTVVNTPQNGEWYEIDATCVGTSSSGNIVSAQHVYATAEIANSKVMEIQKVQAIDLTEAYGAGNEPTLAYIKSHPEEFAWTPNPNDLIETVEIKNNLVGDLENLQGNDFEQHEDGVVTYTTEGEEGSVVRVDIDGISDQPLRFRTTTGEQVVITEHDQVDADAIKKVEFAGNSVQLADKYREVSGTSVVINPTLHDKTVADKLVIGGTTVQKSDYYAKDGLITQSSNYYAKDGLSSQYVDTKTLGKNIFDSSKLGLNAYVSKDSGNSFIVSGGYSNSMTVLNPPFMGLLPNTSYTASMLVSGTGTLSASYGRVSLFNGTSWLHLNVGSTSGAKTTTFTTPSNISSYTQFFVYGSSDSLAVVTVSNIQLELGASATAFEPYKDTVKSGLVMELSGRNFFNDPATTTLQDRSGNGNVGTASGFQYRTTEYADRTADFTGKTNGVLAPNPNIAKALGNGTPMSAPSTFTYELDNNAYTYINVLGGSLYGSSATNSGKAPQHLFSFNVIAEFEKAYGAVPSADQTVAGKIAWLKANLSLIECVWYGYGTCPSGNKAYLNEWVVTSSAWGATNIPSHTSGSVATLSRSEGIPWVSNLIDANGFAHFIAYTDASDGATASTMYTDYVKLNIKYKPASGSDGTGGIKFDGVDDYLTVANNANINPVITGGAIASWYKNTANLSGSISGSIIAKSNAYIAGYWLRQVGKKATFTLYGDTTATVTSTAYINDGNWHYLLATWDNTSLKLYIDGAYDTSMTMPISVTTTTGQLLIGRHPVSGEGYNAGAVSKIQIYNRALSASEVYQNYMAGTNLNLPAPTDPSPVTSNLPAKTYKYTDGSDIYEFTLDSELRGIGTAVDKVVFDKVSKKAFVERRVGKKVLDGTEPYVLAAPTGTVEGFTSVVSSGIAGYKLNMGTGTFISDRLKNGITKATADEGIYSFDTYYGYKNPMFRVRNTRLSTPDTAGFKSWLASNNMTCYFHLELVTSTPVTFTKVTSSPYTEVPMTFLTATPDPLHPADLYSNLPANTYKYTSTDGIYEFTLSEELRGIGTTYDKVVFDRVSHVGYLERRIGRHAVTGAENWALSGLQQNEDCNRFDLSTASVGALSTTVVFNNYYPTGSPNITKGSVWVNNISSLEVRILDYKTRFPNVTSLKSWLSSKNSEGNPMVYLYDLRVPTRTPLTFTKVTSSTKTEVPMAFLTNTPSLDYPASVLSVESGSKLLVHGKNLFKETMFTSPSDLTTVFYPKLGSVQVSGTTYQYSRASHEAYLEANKTYYFKCYATRSVSTGSSAINTYTDINGIQKLIHSKTLNQTTDKQFVELSFTTTVSGNYKIWLYSNYGTSAPIIECLYEDIVFSTENTVYEPYIQTEATIPVTLRSIG